MSLTDKDSIIKALNYISSDMRNIKSYKFNEFIHIYQRPTIEPRAGRLVDGYEMWCTKHLIFLSCFGINIPIAAVWSDEINFDESHAILIQTEVDKVLEKIKINYF